MVAMAIPTPRKGALAGKIPPSKVPKAVHLRAVLPMLTTGKVDKKTLGSKAVDLAGR